MTKHILRIVAIWALMFGALMLARYQAAEIPRYDILSLLIYALIFSVIMYILIRNKD